MSTLKILAAAALLSIPSSAAAKPYPIREEAIVRVDCVYSAGTAVKIGKDRYITAAHVVTSPLCTIAGKPIEDLKFESHDTATFRGPESSHYLRTTCSGFSVDTTYLAIGYGLGLMTKSYTPWKATEFNVGGFHTFFGEAIPGMSGGPVINRKGEVTGIVNMRWPARSRSIADTSLCKLKGK